MKKKNSNNKIESFEKTLFKAADKLRKNMDAAEYKHIVLGLIFLKYISDSFEELYAKIKEGKGDFEGANPEDADEYRAENVFFVPQTARWSYLHSRAMLPSIGKDVDDAMEAIEKENATLKGILPKVYARPNLDKTSLGGLINMLGNIALGDEVSKSKDILGRVYEYFLGEFALAEGKKGGQFYTPQCVVKLLVSITEPYKGRVFDPCCGSGGMFVMSEKLVKEHQGKVDDISIYGQESNQTTYRLARMNLAIRGIDGSQVKWNNEGSFLKDAHIDLKADYILANPPFNQKDWGGDLLKTDGRWKFGIPAEKNANFAWLQHMVYHLSPKGRAGIVLGNGSLVSDEQSDSEIRKNLIDEDLVESVILLPSDIFHNTDIPACLWFLNRNKEKNKGKILFIDARNKYKRINRKRVIITDEQIDEIVKITNFFRNQSPEYKDQKGFCKVENIETIRNHEYFISPGRFVEVVDLEKNIDIKTQFSKLDNEIVNFPLSKPLEKRINKTIREAGKIIFDQHFLTYSGKLVDSEIGEIPKGWKVISVSELVEEVSSKNFDHEDVPVFSVTKNREFVLSEEYFNKQVFSADLKNYKKISQYQFGYNPARINIGSIGFFDLDENGLVSPAYTVFKARDGVSPYFVWYLINSYRIFELIKNFCVGTVRQVFRFKDFSYIKFAIPDDGGAMKDFEKKIREFIDIKKQHEKETLGDLSGVIKEYYE
jgi:type I restriction enzyme M protein